MTEVSMLASHLAMPREGHLEAIFHIYAYLKQKYNWRLAFDPTYLSIELSDFKECGWKQSYGDVTEAMPPNAPEPTGKDVDLWMCVDSDHAGERWHGIQGLDSWSLWTLHSLMHCPRSKLLLRHPYLGPSLLPWSMGWNVSLVCDTSFAWWVLPSQVPPTSTGIICQSSIILSALSLPWRRRATSYVTMLLMNLLLWRSLWQVYCDWPECCSLLTKVLYGYGQKRTCIVGEILYDIYDDF